MMVVRSPEKKGVPVVIREVAIDMLLPAEFMRTKVSYTPIFAAANVLAGGATKGFAVQTACLSKAAC